jgi:hypothetical protein
MQWRGYRCGNPSNLQALLTPGWGVLSIDEGSPMLHFLESGSRVPHAEIPPQEHSCRTDRATAGCPFHTKALALSVAAQTTANRPMRKRRPGGDSFRYYWKGALSRAVMWLKKCHREVRPGPLSDVLADRRANEKHYSRSWLLIRSGDTPVGAGRLEAGLGTLTTARTGSLWDCWMPSHEQVQSD